jgi:non-homologous end joining protein Ku
VSDDPYGDNLLVSIERKKAARREAEAVSATRADHICDLQAALRELVLLERHPAPPWERKAGRYAMMQSGPVLAEALDRAHALLGKTAQ